MEWVLSAPLDLEATLYSGQAFRWTRASNGWHEGLIQGSPARLRVEGDRLVAQAGDVLPESAVRRFLRLDGSHEGFLERVRRDAALEEAMARFPGLRVLSQDPWELLASYIVSANSNVPKIGRTLQALAARWGEPTRLGAWETRRFPTPAALARCSVAELRTTGMGYRAPFLRAAAHLVDRGDLDPEGLVRLPYAEAHARLLEVPGVGPKVADCVLLYGCGHLAAFPIDVWIDRVLRESYFPRRRPGYRAAGEWARRHFGPEAGYAQHFLFHYRRVVGKLPRTASRSAARRRDAASASATRSRTIPAGGGNATSS